LAAASIIFRSVNASYSSTLLSHARQLYTFATGSLGRYSDSVPTTGAYSSYSYDDELVWAAAWLARATKGVDAVASAAYLSAAESGWRAHLWYVPDNFDWDNKAVGATLLLAQLTGGKAEYVGIVQGFVQRWMPGGSVPYTPLGLAIGGSWGTLRLAMNAAFIAVVYTGECVSPLSLPRSPTSPHVHAYIQYTRTEAYHRQIVVGRCALFKDFMKV
jgi:hypothetical protein